MVDVMMLYSNIEINIIIMVVKCNVKFFSLLNIVFISRRAHITLCFFFFFQAEDGIRDIGVTGVQTCALPIYRDARILILDEPTAVLTPQETEDLFSVLKELVADGLSIVLITHKLGELLGVSDEITIIRDGKVVGTVETTQTNQGELARIMVGRDVLLRVEKEASRPGEVRLAADGLVVKGATGGLAVRGVDLAVRGGEILGTAGVDGNGKTERTDARAGVRAARGG